MSKKSRSGGTRRHSFDGSILFRNRFGDKSSTKPLFFNEYSYGRNRRRPNPWDRDDDILCLWKKKRNESKNKESDQTEETSKQAPKPVPKKPEVQVEDTARRLLVENVDFNIQENVQACRTSMYECTEDWEDEDGNPQPPELVIRRGQNFKISITFDQEYSKTKHDLKLCFEIGDKTSITKGTKAEFMLDEDGPKKYKPFQWGAYLESRSGNDVNIRVHTPADCIVGEWKFSVKTICEFNDKAGKNQKKIFQYQHDDDFTILFNPWCEEDEVHMDSSELNEYILNESTGVYRGSSWNFRGVAWDLGQFEAGVLDACLFLLRKAFKTKEKVSPDTADPVKVCRKLVSVINSCDNMGVLEGNWSGNYEGGTSPLKWSSSAAILKKFMKTGPVKYGQCWVFSCVTTAVFRCLGIPCRTVTNFASAHDTDCSNIIEKAHFFVDDEKHAFPGMNDSIWNFHVWNEVWMARKDLGKKEYDGWQVVDATPQEESGGVMTCGPSPVFAIKNGRTNVNHDTAFVYAEVNADVAKFQVSDDGTVERISLETGQVGRNISTKKPDGQVFDEYDFYGRLDLTDNYKFPEDSVEEREAAQLAYKLAKKHNKDFIPYKVGEMEQTVEMKLKHSNKIMIGKEIELEIKVKNLGTVKREISKSCITLAPEAYTGECGDVFYRKRFESITLNPHEEKCLKAVVTFEEYFEHLIEQGNLNIEAVCHIAPAQGEGPHKSVIKTHNFTFSRPALKVEGPATGTVGKEVEFKVSFTNPLSANLTNCDVSMNSSGFRDIEDKAVPDVAKNGEYSGVFKMKPKRKQKHKVVFTFQSNELEDITGSTSIVIS